MRRTSFLFLLLVLLFTHHLIAAQDGVPDNCEYIGGTHYRASIFPRYEPQNQRFVLVDWATGAEVMVLATQTPTTRILGWSADCRYLAAAVGSTERMDTVVWDTVSGGRIGSVPDAYLKPHYITWGVNNYLMVETRNGAVLWNVPANTQIILTTSFNNTTMRNFSRLRWDGANGQVVANLAVGGRVVYDLATGQEVPEAASVLPDSKPRYAGYNSTNTSSFLLAGKEYTCNGSTPDSIQPRFAATAGTMELRFVNYRQYGGASENLVMLDDDLGAYYRMERYHFSPGCRYLVASLAIIGQDATDTVVWDILQNQRMGMMADARQIHHPTHWSPDGNYLIVETRDGAYLWRMADNQQMLLTEISETALAGQSQIKSFHQVAWDVGQNQLLVTEVGSGHGVKVYDLTSGKSIGFYSSGVEGVTASYQFNAQWLIVTGSKSSTMLYRRNSSEGRPLPFEVTGTLKISPDNLLIVHSDFSKGISVWDTATLSQLRTYDAEMVRKISGFDFDPPASGYYRSFRPRLNVLTGELISAEAENLPPAAPIEGESGYGWYTYWYRNYVSADLRGESEPCEPITYTEQRQLVVADRVLEADLNQTYILNSSPNCRYAVGRVQVVSNEMLPYDSAPLADARQENSAWTLVIWDITTGERVVEFTSPYQYGAFPRIVWSPDQSYVFVRVTSGAYVLNTATWEKTLLVFNREQGAIEAYAEVYWDFDRGQIVVTGYEAAYAFDMRTGEQRATYDVGIERYGSRNNCGVGWWADCDMDVDGNKLYVYGDNSFSVNNLDTGENIAVATDHYFGDYPMRAAMSPDGKYAVLAYHVVNVWDLTTLPEVLNDHDTVYSWNLSFRVGELRFIDNVTLEITDRNDTRYLMNVETGTLTKVEE
jgi:WD40 repeat protein